jgi:hypothetical protein
MRTSLLALALVWASVARADKPRLAVLPVTSSGADVAALVPSLTAVITVELARAGTFDVTSATDLEAMFDLERQRDALGCRDEACFVNVGASAGIDRLLRTHLGKLGDSYVLEVAIINARTGRSEGRAYEAVKGGTDKLLAVARRLVADLPCPRPQLDAALSTRPATVVSAWGNAPAWTTTGLGVLAMIGGGILRSRGDAPTAGNLVLGTGAAGVLAGLFWLGTQPPSDDGARGP